LIDGSASIGRMRSVRVEDLLFREPVRLDLGRIREKFEGTVTLITGAGGSIGSELARQVAKFNPGKLLLFDQSENDLHAVDLELREHFPSLQYTPIVGDILDLNRLHEVFLDHHPHSVFHAAAYKHVPMMERNCFQAVTNNIFGTHNVASASKHFGVEDFVFISTDKAVNPSSIMGVTKRIAELMVLGFQNQSTRFLSVRFGNVLGSTGSVLPLFERQIAQRRPITITHPDARRYFMTIPEAVQLVLQASTMGRGGEIFVLDMGEPVKILDLAKGLIKLSGLDPEKDIQIIYTGLRPGEKLFEELKLDGEGIKPTSHDKIRVFDGGTVALVQVDAWLGEISQLVQARDLVGLVGKFREIVPEYTPSPHIQNAGTVTTVS
jgi:FlaA1/EpsC-like NDP-sugar epimerase